MDNYEQKYKEALERMKSWVRGEHSECFSEAQKAAEFIFPELKESEEEKIRKELIAIYSVGAKVNAKTGDIPDKDIVAWLEKQGEKKSREWHSEDEQNLNVVLSFIEDEYLRRWLKDIIHAKYEQCAGCINDKGCVTCVDYNMKETNVEPKFNVGDCIISNDGTHTYLVKERKRGAYIMLDIDDDVEFSILIETADRTGRLWSITDAKDGDVLAFIDNIGDVIICKSPTSYDTRSFCRVVFDIFRPYEESGWDSTLLRPATLTQQNLLFQKMKEAGYEWDNEKKELKKIETTAWSEEDEKIALSIKQVMNCASLLNIVPDKIERIRTWLETLKQRI